jgi:glucokinase
MILAGDIGGTSTRLGLFEPGGPRPRRRAVRVFRTLDFPDLPAMIARFLEAESIDRAAIGSASFGVAGPVLSDTAQLTNVPWRVEGRGVAKAFGLTRVHVLNDLTAMAHSVTSLEAAELHTLQQGTVRADGNISLIAAGTGLGISLLHNVDGRFVPSPSEGGHADYAPRTEPELALLRALTARFGRAEVEHVVSGHGLVNIHRATHTLPCAAGIDLDEPGAPAAISKAALNRRCAGCVAVLDLFVGAYGAEAGNLALGAVATGGVFIGGGIAPKILPAMTSGAFIAAFRAKGSFASLLDAMPVKIILNEEAGLLGAAIFASVHDTSGSQQTPAT